MKTKKSVINVVTVLISQLVTITLGMIVPRLFITSYGSEVNGILSTISQIYIYISLLEAGIGITTIQALYEPIGNKDKYGISAIMNATTLYYKRTGCLYFLAVMIFAGLFPLFVKTTELSKVDIALVIFFQGCGSVVNFWFQGKYKLLFSAEGKAYVTTTIAMITNILNNISKIVLITLGLDVVKIHFVHFLILISQMVIYGIYIKRNYKWLLKDIEPNFYALKQKNAVFVHQISGLIFANTDILILGIACGFKVVSVYAIYNMIFTLLSDTISNVNNSILYNFGQLYFKDKQKYQITHSAYETVYYMISFIIYEMAYLMILPFMRIYTAGITDINYVDYKLAILFLVMKLLVVARVPCNNTINVAGRFKNTQTSSLIESFINLIISFVAVYMFGIYGVLIGTIVALLYRTNDIIFYAHKYLLKKSSLRSYIKLSVNFVVFIIVAYFFKSKLQGIESYSSFFVSCFIYIWPVAAAFGLVNIVLFKNDIFMFWHERQGGNSGYIKESKKGI